MGFGDMDPNAFAAGGGVGFGAGAAMAGAAATAIGSWWHKSSPKAKAQAKAQAARAAKRIAEKDLHRRRIPGDPQLGQRAEYTLTNATNFKRPAHISLGKSKDAPVLMDWLKSLVTKSKFNVQFACDWKSDQNERRISWHCYRHNMCSWKRYFGFGPGALNASDNTTVSTPVQFAESGYIDNAAWPQWMDPFNPNASAAWVGEGSTDSTSNGVFTDMPFKNFMLRPDNTTMIHGSNIQNRTTTGNVNGGFIVEQDVTTPFIPQLHNRIYYAPINISDIEDECWTNNRIINPSQFEQMMGAEVQSQALATNAHRCVSLIGQQNVRYVSSPSAPYVSIVQPTVGQSVPTTGASRNQYKNLIQKGNVNYKFINKADGPCKIEIIVWKFKSTHVAPPCYNRTEYRSGAAGQYTTDSRYYMQFGDGSITAPAANIPAAGNPAPVCNAIQTLLDRYNEAYFQAVTAKYGTDKMSGRVPTNKDLFDDPNFPLFKKYSKYFQESLCDFSEHSRYTYNLQSGQRQEVNIVLPGEHYNPCSVGKDYELNQSQTSGLNDLQHGTFQLPGFASAYGENPVNPFNKYTYFVMIATSGCNMSAAYDKGLDGNMYTDGTAAMPNGPPTGPNSVEVGSAWSSSHVQAYGTYSENIGAATYKSSRRSLYNLGGLRDTSLNAASTEYVGGKAASVYNLNIGPRIPIDRIVRIPPQFTRGRIYNGNTAEHAYPMNQDTSSGHQAATDVPEATTT